MGVCSGWNNTGPRRSSAPSTRPVIIINLIVFHSTQQQRTHLPESLIDRALFCFGVHVCGVRLWCDHVARVECVEVICSVVGVHACDGDEVWFMYDKVNS